MLALALASQSVLVGTSAPVPKVSVSAPRFALAMKVRRREVGRRAHLAMDPANAPRSAGVRLTSASARRRAPVPRPAPAMRVHANARVQPPLPAAVPIAS